jgi:argininosuccinate lyase
LLDLADAVAALQTALLDRAAEHTATVMPGFTHTQHAQPITAGFWLSAHASALVRDGERLQEAFSRTNTSPLGACALAGTSFDTDRAFAARLLGFDGVHEHSLDLIGSRDFVAESMAAAAILMSNLSKLAEELILFSTFEFRMIELDDRFAFGSSIMPQKKNPCVAELARARAGVVYGRLMQVLTMMKATPLGYNRDVQEDKPPLWEALDCTEQTLGVLAGAVRSVQLNDDRMRELAGAYFEAATELANLLVRERGLPFREAHGLIGAIVLALAGEGKTFEDHGRVHELLAAEGVVVDPEALRQALDPVCIVRAQRSLGSTAPDEVERMIGGLRATVNRLAAWAGDRREHIGAARRLTTEGVERLLGGGSIEDWPAA